MLKTVLIAGLIAVVVWLGILARRTVKRLAAQQLAEAHALAEAFPVEQRAAVGYAAWVLISMLNVPPSALHPQVRLLEDLRMDDLEDVDVSVTLAEDGIKLTPDEVMQAVTFEGFVRLLVARVEPAFFAQWAAKHGKPS